jgi:hypothetical protein
LSGYDRNQDFPALAVIVINRYEVDFVQKEALLLSFIAKGRAAETTTSIPNGDRFTNLMTETL